MSIICMLYYKCIILLQNQLKRIKLIILVAGQTKSTDTSSCGHQVHALICTNMYMSIENLQKLVILILKFALQLHICISFYYYNYSNAVG